MNDHVLHRQKKAGMSETAYAQDFGLHCGDTRSISTGGALCFTPALLRAFRHRCLRLIGLAPVGAPESPVNVLSPCLIFSAASAFHSTISLPSSPRPRRAHRRRWPRIAGLPIPTLYGRLCPHKTTELRRIVIGIGNKHVAMGDIQNCHLAPF
jgi:hypothetical protein